MAEDEIVQEAPAEETPGEVAEEIATEQTEDVSGETPEVPQDFPDDWRARMAGEDEKLAKMLDRYASPSAAAKALGEAKTELRRKQEPMKAPGKDASEEEIAAYREAAGIPAELEQYVEAVPLADGVIVGDDDKPILEAFAADFHANNIPAETLGVAYDRYMKLMEETAERQADLDEENKIAAMAELKQEMGASYKANMNALRPFFDGMSEGAHDRLLTARTSDGKLIGDDPDILRVFIGRALENNPASTIVPPGANQESTINSEIAELESFMRTNRDEWFKDDEKQKRLQLLYDAQERLNAA